MPGLGESCSTFTLKDKRIWVAGHRGMVGAAIVRRLGAEDCEILTAGRETVDLRRQVETEDWIAEARPDGIVLAAATVGGILANDTRPANFIYDNLAIETNVLEAARRVGVGKLLLLGSSCIYPRLAPQPMTEDALLTGALEPTNQWYAVAKIAGVVGYQGEFRYDITKPDGTPRKLLDVSWLRTLGWTATTTLRDGLAKTYDWYVSQGPGAEYERVSGNGGGSKP